jgi:hypothetical protein
MTPQQEQRIAEALRHVEMGFAVVSVWSTTPEGVCKCGKDHTGREKAIGKHPIPASGFLAASTDPKTVQTMLSAGSEPNYGSSGPRTAPKGSFWSGMSTARREVDHRRPEEGLRATAAHQDHQITLRWPASVLQVA